MTPNCLNCHEPLQSTDAFCGSCGNRVSMWKEEKERSGLILVIVFYIVFLVYSMVSYTIYQESDTLLTEILVELVFVLLTILFSLFDARRILALYNIAKLHWKILLFVVTFPLITSVVVYYGIDWFSLFLDADIDNVFWQYAHFPNTFLWVFVFTVIIPPIFEELAFRGFLFNQLLEISNWKVTVLATAFLFALVHFSMMSFLWIFPFGMMLGYLRYRYNTLWLGMIVHFIHNFLVVMLDYYYFNFEIL